MITWFLFICILWSLLLVLMLFSSELFKWNRVTILQNGSLCSAICIYMYFLRWVMWKSLTSEVHVLYLRWEHNFLRFVSRWVFYLYYLSFSNEGSGLPFCQNESIISIFCYFYYFSIYRFWGGWCENHQLLNSWEFEMIMWYLFYLFDCSCSFQF